MRVWTWVVRAVAVVSCEDASWLVESRAIVCVVFGWC